MTAMKYQRTRMDQVAAGIVVRNHCNGHTDLWEMAFTGVCSSLGIATLRWQHSDSATRIGKKSKSAVSVRRWPNKGNEVGGDQPCGHQPCGDHPRGDTGGHDVRNINSIQHIVQFAFKTQSTSAGGEKVCIHATAGQLKILNLDIHRCGNYQHTIRYSDACTQLTRRFSDSDAIWHLLMW